MTTACRRLQRSSVMPVTHSLIVSWQTVTMCFIRTCPRDAIIWSQRTVSQLDIDSKDYLAYLNKHDVWYGFYTELLLIDTHGCIYFFSSLLLLSLLFTARSAMLAQYIAVVILSVCLSVRYTRALWQNQTMHCIYFDTARKSNHYFLIPTVVGGRPLPSKICA